MRSVGLFWTVEVLELTNRNIGSPLFPPIKGNK